MKIIAAINLLVANYTVAYGANIGKNVGEYFLDQLIWFEIVGVLIVIGVCIVKKNTIGAIIAFVAGSLGAYLIETPDALKTFGKALGKIFGI